jgi:Flp pilus assembly protein TadB
MDEAPHTWLAPMLIAYAWLIISLMIFLDSYYLLLWWHLPVAIAIVSLIIGLVKGIRFHRKKEKVKEGER